MQEELSTYIAGPMTGRKDHNFPAFRLAAQQLREAGWIVVNPAEGAWNKKRDRPWEFYMAHDISRMVHCDSLHVLPGYKKSKGARLEIQIAKRLKKSIYKLATGERIA
jgi:hypothetical protein